MGGEKPGKHDVTRNGQGVYQPDKVETADSSQDDEEQGKHGKDG